MSIFPKRWHHGHSLTAGALAGMVVYGYAPYLLFAIGATAGAAAVCLGVGLYRLGRTLLDAYEAWRSQSRAKAETLAAGPVPVYGRKPGGAYNDEIGF
jgi:hypothetical protein